MKITIKAGTGQFKTTVARLIAQALTDAGVAVSLEDDGEAVDTSVEDPLQKTRLDVLRASGMTFEVVTDWEAPSMPPAPPPWWSLRSRGAQAYVAAMCDGTVRGTGELSVREMYDADYVAMVDPQDDALAVVTKCRYGVFDRGTYLDKGHAADIAMAYSAMRYADEHVFFSDGRKAITWLQCASPEYERSCAFQRQVIEACRISSQETRRARIAGLLAQLV